MFHDIDCEYIKQMMKQMNAAVNHLNHLSPVLYISLLDIMRCS